MNDPISQRLDQVYIISNNEPIYMMKLPVNAFERALEKSRHRIAFCRSIVNNWEDVRECVEFAVDKVLKMGTVHTKQSLMDYCMGILKMESEVIEKALSLYRSKLDV